MPFPLFAIGENPFQRNLQMPSQVPEGEVKKPSYLAEKGLHTALSYQNDVVGNPIGGKSQRISYADSYGALLVYDFGRLTPCKGLSISNSYVFRTGYNLSSRHIGNAFAVNQTFGKESWRLYGLFLEQKLFHDHLEAKFGRMSPGDDFIASPIISKRFLNNATNGTPFGILFNLDFAVYPTSVWGGFTSWIFNANWRFLSGVYTTNQATFANRYHGFNWTYHCPKGVMWVNELNWLLQIINVPANLAQPGQYKLGVAYQTGFFEHFMGGKTHGDYACYFLGSHMVYKPYTDKDIGLTPFLAVAASPKNRSQLPFFITGGFCYKGPASFRPQDVLSLGIAHGAYSSDLRRIQNQARKRHVISPFGNRPQSRETDIELTYLIQLNRLFVLTPSLQYIINPKGYGTIPNAFVIGIQLSFNVAN